MLRDLLFQVEDLEIYEAIKADDAERLKSVLKIGIKVNSRLVSIMCYYHDYVIPTVSAQLCMYAYVQYLNIQEGVNYYNYNGTHDLIYAKRLLENEAMFYYTKTIEGNFIICWLLLWIIQTQVSYALLSSTLITYRVFICQFMLTCLSKLC